ncbi:TetR/AcrR family transcriptional regulator [Spirosoma luteolum]
MKRDRKHTEHRLLEAVGEIIAAHGLDHVRINKVASWSGINKILIYRYFGGLDGLLEAYHRREQMTRSNAFIDLPSLKDYPLDDLFDSLCEQTLQEYRRLRSNVYLQEYLKADLIGSDTPYNPLVAERAGKLRHLIDEVSAHVQTKQGRAFTSVMISAMTLLTFMAQQKRSILDIDLDSENGWQEIEEAVRSIYRGIYLVVQERSPEPTEKTI